MVLESMSYVCVIRAGTFPSAKLCVTHSTHKSHTGWVQKYQPGGAHISLRCLRIAASQSYTDSSTILWPIPFRAQDTLHSICAVIPGFNTTLEKWTGSSHISDSPSRYISMTAYCSIHVTHSTCYLPNFHQRHLHRHIGNVRKITHNNSMDAFNDNPAAFIFNKVDKAVIDIALHFFWYYRTTVPFQYLPPTNKNKAMKWKQKPNIFCIVLKLKAAWQYSACLFWCFTFIIFNFFGIIICHHTFYHFIWQ